MIRERKFTTVVWNSGQHPASGGYHWTYAQYRRMMQSFINGMEKANLDIQVFVMETVPFPPRDDKWVQHYKDWRTSTRLMEYNRILAELVNGKSMTAARPSL